ncbi:MAG: hypothetical protein QXK94_07625 [Candidatus Jordarchaeales archaeon]
MIGFFLLSVVDLHWLARLVSGLCDEGLHRRFVKYSAGTFGGPRLEVSVRGGYVTLRGDLGYEDLIGWFVVRLMGDDESCSVSGVALGKMCTELFKESGNKVEAKGEMYKVKVNSSFKAGELRRIYEEYSDECTMLFSIKTARGASVKCKTRIDWMASLGGEEGGGDINFCVGRVKVEGDGLKILLEQTVPDFLDVVPRDFKRMLVANEFVIEKLIPPECGEGLTVKELRVMSKRKGKVKRSVNVDGKTFYKEVEFTV